MRTYKPNQGQLTYFRVRDWVNQFPDECRADAARLAANLQYFSENQIIEYLTRLNVEIERRLSEDGVPSTNILYISFDDPPSSSPAMCRLLRDQGGLGAGKFIPSTSGSKIHETTRRLREGAIIYVDDFAGSGTQFRSARNEVRDYIDGTFSEFFLLPCICDEALKVVESEGVVPVYEKRHAKSERPLLEQCDFFEKAARERLVGHSERTWGIGSLGFGMLATNVILSHAAPDTTPIVFRGDIGQRPWFGIVPRWGELENASEIDSGHPP